MSIETKENTRPREGLQAKPHAIQLVALQTVELSVKVTGDPSLIENIEGNVSLESAYSPYDETDKSIQVRLRAVISESEDMPLDIKAEVIGVFKVDEDNFKREFIIDWASANAPLVLYPYVREHVFALSVRVGAKGLIMPLLEVPSFRITAQQKTVN